MIIESIRRNISDMLFLLGDQRRKLPFILATFLVVSLLDLIGVGLVYIINRIRTGEPLRIPLPLVIQLRI